MPTLDPTPFLDALFAALERDGIDVAGLHLDHLCYRVASLSRYAELKATLASRGVLLAESEIGGRPIATFRLHRPLTYAGRSITVLELPAPKAGSPYPEGFEHAEFVVPMEPRSFAALHPELAWDLSGARKPVNADVRLNYGGVSVKFHQRALAEVIAEEQRDQAVKRAGSTSGSNGSPSKR